MKGSPGYSPSTNAPAPERTLVVEGVRLTASVILKAYQELQTPEAPVVTNLMRVQSKPEGRYKGVVIFGTVQERYKEAYNRQTHGHKLVGPYTVVDDIGSDSTFDTAEQLFMCWAPIKEDK